MIRHINFYSKMEYLNLSQDSFQRPSQNKNQTIQRLQQKVKLQAQRLRTQNKYIQLVERRLLEIVPSHPIPVEPAHLGECFTQEEDIQQQHNELLLAYSKLKQQKQVLDQNLRNQLILSQEQRSFIEVLQQNISDLKNNPPQQQKKPQKLNLKVFQQEKIVRNLQQQLETQKQQFLAEREEFQMHLKQAEEALQLADQEVHKLEEEKSALLEYVDQHQQIESQMRSEYSQMLEEYTDLQQAYQKLQGDIKEGGLITSEFQEIQRQKLEVQQKLKEQLEVVNKLKKVQEQSENYLKNEIKILQQKNQNLSVNNTTFSNTLKQTQNELENLSQVCQRQQQKQKEYKISVNTLQEKLKLFMQSLENLQQELQEKNDRIFYLEKQGAQQEIKQVSKGKYKKQIKELQEKLLCVQDLTKKNIELQKLVKSLQVQVKKNATQSKKFSSENKEFQKKTKEFQKAQNQLQQEYNRQMEIIQDLQRKLSTQQCSHSMAKAQILSLKARIEQLNQSSKISQDTFYQRQIQAESAKEQIEGLQFQISLLKSSLHQQKQQFQQLKLDYTKNKEILQQVQISAKSLKSTLTQIISQLQSAKSDLPQRIRLLLNKTDSFSNLPKAFALLMSIYKQSQTSLSTLTLKLQQKSLKLQQKNAQFSSLTREISTLKSRQKTLSEQLESMSLQTRQIRDSSKQRMASTQSELKTIKKQYKFTTQKLNNLKDQILLLQSQKIENQATIQSQSNTITTLQQKLSFLSQQKSDLENHLNRLNAYLPSSDLQRLFFEISKVRKDLQISNREKLNLQSQLARLQQKKPEDTHLHRQEVSSVRTEISKCEGHILAYTSRLKSLDEELEQRSVDFSVRDRFNISLLTQTSLLSSPSKD